MFIFGGWNGNKCLNDLNEYSFLSNIWYNIRKTKGTKPKPRYRHESIIYQNSIYIFGGISDINEKFNDLY